MNKSAEIRALHSRGIATAEIARQLGISYQFAYNVIRQDGGKPSKQVASKTARTKKPQLTVQRLLEGGFSRASRWEISTDGKLKLGVAVPKMPGVYAFVKNGVVQYVGVATKSLAQRLYFYANPGPKQSTNQRLKKILEGQLQEYPEIEIFTISVSDCAWGGWKMDGNLGLEGGIISNFDVPWNARGASPFFA